MYVKIEKRADYRNAKLLQKTFPEITRGIRKKDNTLLLSAQSIKDCVPKPIFANKSISTIQKYLRIALRGGIFTDDNGKEYEIKSLMEDFDECVNGRRKVQKGFKKMREVTGYIDWTDEEKNFVLDFYKKGYGPKKIYDLYSLQPDFNTRSRSGISTFLDFSRKKNLIDKLNIQWEEDVGFFALELLIRYGKDTRFIQRNAKCLDEYFFDGKGLLTRSKLQNFYKRNKELIDTFDFSKSIAMPYISKPRKSRVKTKDGCTFDDLIAA